MDPLTIMTLSDNEDPLTDSEESEVEGETKVADMREEFAFQGDGGLDFKKGWDYSALTKLYQKEKVNGRTTLDEKIAKKKIVTMDSEDEVDQQEIEPMNDDEESAPVKERKIVVEKDEEQDEADILKEKRIKEYFEEAPVVEDQLESFTSLSLSRPILKAIASQGFVTPTIIQARTIPLALQGRDICASAITGSGKTAAFIIPILERLLFRPKQAVTRVLVLVPTRELGAQCQAVAIGLSKFSSITTCLCVGGLSNKIQEQELLKKPDIVIATPGRLIDHLHNSLSFSLDQIEILVMDEADRILEDGFKAELEEIIKHTPKNRQTMLFSATMTDNIDDLIKMSLSRPIRLFVDSALSLTTKLVQEFVRIRGHKEEARPAILASLCVRTFKQETLIFFRSKAAAHHMKIVFGLLGLKAAELHGNLTQLQRLESLEQFRERKVDFLLCTDVASRGLDIAGIKTVINYDMPQTYQVYVHRCGRTARGDAGGRAVSLVGEADRVILKMALKNSRDAVKHRVVPNKIVERFEKKIEETKDTVKEIYDEEKEEKLFGMAEMEMKKAQNRIDHEKEIGARPARTWFQTEREKMNEKEIVVKADTGPKRGVTDGLSRRKKRLYQSRVEDKEANASQVVAARSAKSALKMKKVGKIDEKKDAKKVTKGKRGGSFGKEMDSKRIKQR